METVNVWDSEKDKRIIAQVKYRHNLNAWNRTGRDKGITKLRDGRHVIIYGAKWEDEKDYAIVVTPEEALQEILRSEKEELLEEPRFASLKLLYEQLEQEEE